MFCCSVHVLLLRGFIAVVWCSVLNGVFILQRKRETTSQGNKEFKDCIYIPAPGDESSLFACVLFMLLRCGGLFSCCSSCGLFCLCCGFLALCVLVIRVIDVIRGDITCYIFLPLVISSSLQKW